MFIQTESTPNPATLKFLPGRDVMGEGAVADFPDREAAGRSPLADALFEIPEVGRVFFGSDFVSVTKSDGDWQHLKPAILGAIMEHFTRGLPLIEARRRKRPRSRGYSEDDAEIVDADQGADRDARAPGGGAGRRRHHLQGFRRKAGIVFLQMRGSCAGCPSSTMTLKNGIENMLRHYIPEVNAVEAV